MNLYCKKENCCGCTSCMNSCPRNAISMVTDSEGFLYPVISPELCIECGLCKKACPFKDDFEIGGNIPIPDVYAAKNNSDDIRLSSTSGGMFTALSDHVLSMGGAIFGAAFDENLYVRHEKATTEHDRDRFKGSKYVQSDLQETFKVVKQCLENGQEVLFTGTPCQTAGLHSFLTIKKTDMSKLYLCDIVCHGVPSPLIWKEHIDFLSKRHKSTICRYNFRYSWRGINVYAAFNNGHSIINGTDLLIYTEFFYSLIAMRPSCHNCKFCNFKRPSDITIADFWGLENTMPEFNDEKGVSLVLVNTIKGKELFNKIKHKLEFQRSNTTACLQQNLKSPSKASPLRDKFWQDYNNRGYIYVIKKYGKYDTISKTKKLIKNICSLKLMGSKTNVKGLNLTTIKFIKNRVG